MKACASLFALGYHWLLPLATIDLIGEFEFTLVYFDLLYPLQVFDGLRTLNVNNCLSLFTIGCP